DETKLRRAGIKKRQMSIGVRRITKISKHKSRTFKCVRQQLVHGCPGSLQRPLAPGKADHDPGKQELQSQTPQYRLQADGPAVGGAHVSDRQKDDDAQQTRKSRHWVLLSQKLKLLRENPVYCSWSVKAQRQSMTSWISRTTSIGRRRKVILEFIQSEFQLEFRLGL